MRVHERVDFQMDTSPDKSSDRAGQVERRRKLRRESTDAELALWRLLRSRQLGGWKFRRQHQVGHYIVDFCCPEQRLAIEADGYQHLSQEGLAKDEERTSYLKLMGIRVLRFTNRQILLEIDGVQQAIWEALSGEPSP
ncbi:MAG: endonuclease domain-containing protein [Dehalococcoidia bacterium]|nr:endonuclease domain-containing protein [Dehalococcoidia bacterium]